MTDGADPSADGSDAVDSVETVLVDGVQLDVASDPKDAHMIVTGVTVSASEKASTGDYENIEPYESVQASVRPPIDASTRDGRSALARKVATLHARVQKDVQTAIDRRLNHNR